MGATGTGCSVAGTITSSELCGGIRSALAQYHSKWNTHVSLSYRGLREQFRNVDQKLKVAKVDCLLYVVDNVTRSSDLEEGEENPDEVEDRNFNPGSAHASYLPLEYVHREKRQIDGRHVLSRAERIKRLRFVSSRRGCLSGEGCETSALRSVKSHCLGGKREDRRRKSDRAEGEQTRNTPSALFSCRGGADTSGFRDTIDRDLLNNEVCSHEREIQDEIENRRVEQDYRGLKERVEGPHESEGPRKEVVEDKHVRLGKTGDVTVDQEKVSQ